MSLWLVALLVLCLVCGVCVGVWFATARARRSYVERMTYPADEDEHKTLWEYSKWQ